MAAFRGDGSPALVILAASTTSPTAGTLPGRWTRAIASDTAVRRALARPAPDTTHEAAQTRRARLYALLAAEGAALAELQAAFDSLKATLPEVPPGLAAAPAELAAPAADSARTPTPDSWRRLPPAASPWALLGLLETTPSWSTLPVRSAVADRERTQASLSQSVQLQRQFGRRWLVRAGLGQLATQSQVRRTSERSGETIKRDSSQITDVIVRLTSTTSTLTHVIDTVVQVDPITNLSGQIVGYDTTLTFITETITATILGHDTLRTTRTLVTTRTETWREAREQLFRPRYRFWTLPMGVQYQILQTNRWAVGLNLGGQLTVFRGGERPVWTGEAYAMQRVSARQGPYRPVSFSASAGLEATYRLSPRLSALVAPTVRAWVVPPGRGESATQTLLPALQVGLTYGF